MTIAPALPVALSLPLNAALRFAIVSSLDGLGECIPGDSLHGTVRGEAGSGRYLVNIGAGNLTIESSVALPPGTTFSGRFANIAGRPVIEAARIALPLTQATATSPADASVALPVLGVALQQLFRRHNVTLAADELATLLEACEHAPEPGLVTGAALMLLRSGQRVSRNRIDAILAPVVGESTPLFEAAADALIFETDQAPATAAASANGSFVDILSDAIRAASAPSNAGQAEDRLARVINDDSRRALPQFHWNAANGPVRAGTLPIEVDGELSYLDLAVHCERNGEASENPDFQQAALSLQTFALGTVGIDATVVDRHVRITLTVDSQSAAGHLARHENALRTALLSDKWLVDHVRYEASGGATHNPVRIVLRQQLQTLAGVELRV